LRAPAWSERKPGEWARSAYGAGVRRLAASRPSAPRANRLRPTSYCMSIIDISTVKAGSHVTLHYRLALADGADIVNTFGDKPATLLLGAGQLAAPLEDILMGMKTGDHSTFRLGEGEAFGPRNPELIQRVSLATLRENGMMGEDFAPGDLIEFNAPSGGRYAGVLKEIGETSALFDFNHPLAGQALTFEVQIIGIL
jgi:FKBP-type peptidyl-prolyl cis-trans isomerase SlpA